MPQFAVDEFNHLLLELYARADGNVRRAALYDQTAPVKALSGARSAEFARVKAVLGWTTKAADSLAKLVVLDGLVIPGVDLAEYGLDVYLTENRVIAESNQIQLDAVIHGPAFLVTTSGDVAAGEPAALTTMATATQATGRWNARARRLDSFVSVHAVDENSQATAATLYLHGGLTFDAWVEESTWRARVVDTGLSFVPVEPLVLSPRAGRPFGSSRITNAAVSCQEGALRTIVRSELGAEAYIDPVRAFLGADNSQFLNDDGSPNAAARGAASGRIVVIPPNWVGADGNVIGPDEKPIVPTLQTIPGATMTPHRDQLDMYASLFSSETDIPLSEMGIKGGSVPVSAQALQAARNSLDLRAESAGRDFGGAYVRSAQTAYMIRERVESRADLPRDLLRLSAKYRDPSRPSRGEAGDFMSKMIAAGVVPATSSVALEALGFDQGDIERIQADRRTEGGLAALLDLARTPSGPVATPQATATPASLGAVDGAGVAAIASATVPEDVPDGQVGS